MSEREESPMEEKVKSPCKQSASANKSKKRHESCIFILLKIIKPKKSNDDSNPYANDAYFMWRACWRTCIFCQNFIGFIKPPFKSFFKFIELLALVAAVITAIVIYKQLKEMQTDRYLDERAWVLPLAIDPSPQLENDVEIFTIFCKNTAKTPALNVRYFVHYALSTNDIPKRDTNSTADVDLGMEPPGGEFHVNPLVPPYIVLRNGIFYIYGTIWYDDIFGSNHWSQTGYIIRTTPTITNGIFHIGGSPLPFRNTCDDAQTNQPNL